MIYYQKSKETTEKPGQIISIPTQKIFPNPNQPRKDFSEESILKLADSINQYGIIQPLTVRKNGESYELVAGERRLRAAKELGLSDVPCIIISINDEKSAEISIIENLLREDLNVFEQAEAIEALIDTYGLTQEQIAAKLSTSQSFIANKLRLLRLSAEERELILKNRLSERHARALLRLPNRDLRLKTLNKVLSEGLNVALTENLVDTTLNGTNCDPSQEEKTQKALQKQPQKAVNSFYSAIFRAVDSLKLSGLAVKSRRIEGDGFTEITITIPKERSTTEDQLE